MRWRSELVFAVTLLGGVTPLVAVAQQAPPPPDPACACFVKPGGPGEPGNPGEPGTPPRTPSPDDDSASPGRTWALLGATGLALLSGVPFGAPGVGGLPFAQGTPGTPPTQVAQVPPPPTTPTERGGEVVETPPPTVPGTPPPPPVRPGLPDSTAVAPVPPGLVPPKTATHLPLFGALGVLMTGAGAFLAHRTARLRRRRKRFVPL